jgi:hypothetical protein
MLNRTLTDRLFANMLPKRAQPASEGAWTVTKL